MRLIKKFIVVIYSNYVEKLIFIFNKFIFSDSYCPGVFDGWSCWPDTLAGHSAFTPCPEFIQGFDVSSKYD